MCIRDRKDSLCGRTAIWKDMCGPGLAGKERVTLSLILYYCIHFKNTMMTCSYQRQSVPLGIANCIPSFKAKAIQIFRNSNRAISLGGASKFRHLEECTLPHERPVGAALRGRAVVPGPENYL